MREFMVTTITTTTKQTNYNITSKQLIKENLNRNAAKGNKRNENLFCFHLEALFVQMAIFYFCLLQHSIYHTSDNNIDTQKIQFKL